MQNMRTNYQLLCRIAPLLTIIILCCCTPKTTEWEFAGSRRMRFEVPYHNHNELFIQGLKASDVYIINVDIYTRYQDGKRIYGVRNDDGNIYPDDHAGVEVLYDNLYIHNFRYDDVIGIITEEYQNMP